MTKNTDLEDYIQSELADYEDDDGAEYCFQPNEMERFQLWSFVQHLLGERKFLKLAILAQMETEDHNAQRGCPACGCPPPEHWGPCDGQRLLQSLLFSEIELRMTGHTPPPLKDHRRLTMLTPSEAVYGFAGWLTSRDESVTASARHDAAVWADLVQKFCDANGLEPPREGWEASLVHPLYSDDHA